VRERRRGGDRREEKRDRDRERERERETLVMTMMIKSSHLLNSYWSGHQDIISFDSHKAWQRYYL
jgi:hypothetical protein